MKIIKSLLITLLILKTSSSFARGASEIQGKLMELRSKIQQEADELEAERLKMNSNLQSLTVKKGELESRTKLLEMRNKTLSKSLSEKKKIYSGKAPNSYDEEVVTLNESLDLLKEYLNSTVPFRVNERKKQIESMQEKRKNEELTAAEFFDLYWAFLQRELRLSESVELQKDYVTVEDQRIEVKLLKLGMHSLYFKTLNDEFGYYEFDRNKSVWKTKWIKDSRFKEALRKVYSARSKGLSDGFYQLPRLEEGVKDVL